MLMPFFGTVRITASRIRSKELLFLSCCFVMTNISEGFDRSSNKEFIQFLIIARGSLSEVRSLSYAALDIGYLQSTQATSIQEKSIKLSNLINGFIRYLKTTDRKH